MMNILLAQYGAGGLSWLVFTLGLIWCSFSWWRVHRCKIALASALTAIGTCIGILLLIGCGIGLSFGSRGLGSGADMELFAHIMLGFFVLITLCWMSSAILLLIAARRVRMTPEEYIARANAQQLPHQPLG